MKCKDHSCRKPFTVITLGRWLCFNSESMYRICLQGAVFNGRVVGSFWRLINNKNSSDENSSFEKETIRQRCVARKKERNGGLLISRILLDFSFPQNFSLILVTLLNLCYKEGKDSKGKRKSYLWQDGKITTLPYC